MLAKAGLWAPILSLFGPISRNIRSNYLLIQRLSRAQHRSNEVVLESRSRSPLLSESRPQETESDPVFAHFWDRIAVLNDAASYFLTGSLEVRAASPSPDVLMR